MSRRVSMSMAISSACSGDMYSGVPTIVPKPVNRRVLGQPDRSVALATPKSMTLGTGLSSCKVDEDVRRLDVAVDDPLLVGMLDRLADRDEQLEPIRGDSSLVVAELGERDALHKLHHEVRRTVLGRAGIEQLGDIRVVHDRDRLPLGFEPRQDRR